LAHADEGVLRMQRSLEQLLLLARLEAGEAGPSGASSHPGEAAHEAVREVETSCRCMGRIEIDVQPSLPRIAVPDRLVVSGVRNLVENAVRASPPGSEIRLEVSRHAGGGVMFRVLDRGPGLTEEECAQAVRRFWRRGRTGHGSGLGLSIVQAIAQRYGGALLLAPRAGGGLSAELVLPA
jgi:signal transduction histidine kinase